MDKRKLLLAEDDEDDRMLFSDFLKDRNDFELVYSCENGMEVIEYLDAIEDADKLPNLVVLDQNMPKLKGSETIWHLKEISGFENIPVVIYTTYHDSKFAETCKKMNVELFQKPDSFSDFSKMIGGLIDRYVNG